MLTASSSTYRSAPWPLKDQLTTLSSSSHLTPQHLPSSNHLHRQLLSQELQTTDHVSNYRLRTSPDGSTFGLIIHRLWLQFSCCSSQIHHTNGSVRCISEFFCSGHIVTGCLKSCAMTSGRCLDLPAAPCRIRQGAATPLLRLWLELCATS